MRLSIKVFASALAVLLVTGVGWAAYTYREALVPIEFQKPCASPIPYRIGSVDSRFNTTEAQLLSELKKGAALWNIALSKELLIYAPSDPHAIPVNFVYDERQQRLILGGHLSAAESSQESGRQAIIALEQRYESAQNEYANVITAFNAEGAKYDAEVSAINAAGGADPATVNRLNRERARLESKRAALTAQGENLQNLATTLNAQIAAFNAQVSNFNQIVNTFNAVSGGDFEEGEYVRTATSTTITIYAYASEKELEHTLAHEFGHALGLLHNDNPASIMFPYNKSGVALSVDDIEALKSACNL